MFESFGSYLVYFAILMIIPLWAQARVKSTYSKFSKVATSSHMSGVEVARKILDDNGLYHVKIEETKVILFNCSSNPIEYGELVLVRNHFHVGRCSFPISHTSR